MSAREPSEDEPDQTTKTLFRGEIVYAPQRLPNTTESGVDTSAGASAQYGGDSVILIADHEPRHCRNHVHVFLGPTPTPAPPPTPDEHVTATAIDELLIYRRV